MKKFLILLIVFAVGSTGFSQETVNQGGNQPQAYQLQENSPKFGFVFSFGTVVINGVTYFQIKGQPQFSIGKFGIGLDLNFEFDGQWNLRATEWNSWQAILSKIMYLSWGNKGEKPIYFKIGRIQDATLGNGFIVYNYNNNLNFPNVKKFGIAFDIDLDYVGIETLVDNIFDFDIIGGRVFFRPLYGTGIFLIDMLEIGSTFAADLDPLNPIPPSENPYSFSDSLNNRKVFIVGGDVGIPILKLDPVINLKWYADFAYIVDKGTGEATGLLGRILSFIPYRFEVRFLQPKFIPSFFDALYEAERYTTLGTNYITKYDTLDNITNQYFGWFFLIGISFENIASFIVNMDDSFDDTTYPTLRVSLTIEKDLTKIIGLSFIYERKNIREFKDVYTTESTDSIVCGKLSYKVSEMVNLILEYRRTFDWFDEGGQKVLKPLESTSISTEISF